MKIIRVGIDIHGVIDKDPEFFSALTKKLSVKGHEIHILTGRELDDELVDRLCGFDISYNQIFSITSYHKSINTPMKFKNGDPTQPLISDLRWDSTKAKYAQNNRLDFHIDDSPIYGKYFAYTDTQYLRYTSELRELLTTIMQEF
jgi:hypothetical protein